MIERSMTVEHGDVVATADVKANWGEIEIHIREPRHRRGIVWRRGCRGFITAMLAEADHDHRYAYRGALTERALQLAEKLVIRAIEGQAQIARHAEMVALRCIDVHDRTKRLRSRPRGQDMSRLRSALKRCFMGGLLHQREYQDIVSRLGRNNAEQQFACDEAIDALRAGIVSGLLSHPVRFEHAIIYLTELDTSQGIDRSLRGQLVDIRQKFLGDQS